MSAQMLNILLIALPLGAGLGFFGGLFGIGGGIIAIPVLVLGFGLDQATAQGTALVMMVPNLLLGWWRYAQHNPVPLGRALQVAAVGAATTWGTAQFAHLLDQGLLRTLFALFLLFVAIRMIMANVPKVADKGRDPRWLPMVGLAGGSSMGLLGVGGGLVVSPLLTGWFGLGQRVAQSFALAMVAPSSVFALGAYAHNQRVDWLLGLVLAVGGTLTVAAGVALAHRWPERVLRRAFGWMMAATSVWLVISQHVLGR